ncbi:flagellar biosynthesis protein FlhF [Saccharospirillum salsuginis]|uniref:Flagellar biosynthesis protein FlhF n=1 Tax=Saccharospirillum salsuginis TaxID=418750 RepID=A0A918K5C6_9GAMM|nr:flagellar biosynthesis protein FlhF [Saccharospirillum salsuginis]GGX50812.1 flagellar biosynthesis regulator FlhF [Saccharospirillum salsuginis]
MKVKRFVVPSMQVGLKQVADALGPGAVILSNKKLAQGLEIVAGVDEADLAEYEAQRGPEPDPDAIIKAKPQSESGGGQSKLDQNTLQELLQAMAPKNRAAFGQPETPVERPEPMEPTPRARPAPIPEPTPQPVEAREASSPRAEQPAGFDRQQERELMSVMREEIDSLRRLLQRQTDFLNEPPMPRQSPQLERLEARFQALGLSGSVQRSLLRHFDPETPLDTNWRRLLGRLAAGLSVPMFDPLAQGGMIALCGPTGAGKTTTLAKMAARYVKEQGPEGVTIVSTDYFQLGAQDSLALVARILGVEFVGVKEGQSLSRVLDGLGSRSLVLIDTSGSREAMRQWKKDVADTDLDRRLQTVMVVPATAHSDSLKQFVQAFPGRHIAGAIITKLDEAPCFGSIFDCVLRHRWSLWFSTDGQNIPKDIHRCDPAGLVKRLARGLSQTHPKLAVAS